MKPDYPITQRMQALIDQLRAVGKTDEAGMLEELARTRKTFSVHHEDARFQNRVTPNFATGMVESSVLFYEPVAVVTIYDEVEGISEYRAPSLLLALEREKAYRESKAGGHTWAS